MTHRLVAIAALLCAAACTRTISGAEAGEDRFNSFDGISPSTINRYSCATCHQVGTTPDPSRLDAGYNLRGAARRTSWWGGQAIRLSDAVDQCLVYFMRGDPLDRDSEAARELYEYLESISPPGSDPTPRPFTVVENIAAIPSGDMARGETVYRASCQSCHGALHTGDGQILKKKIILPEFTDSYDQIFPNIPKGLVVIEKIRHGRFFGTGGTMALFSPEAMTDAQIGDVLAYLGLTSEPM